MGTAAPGRTLGCRVRLTKWRIYETENTLRLDYRFCDVFDAFGRSRSAPFFRGLYSALGRGIFNGQGHDSLISMLSFIVYGVSQPVIGRLVDRFGPRIILSLSTLLVGLSIFFTYLVTSPWQLFILYGIIVSLGVGGASNVASTVIVTNWFNEKRGLHSALWKRDSARGRCCLSLDRSC